MLKIVIRTENKAFEDENLGNELSRILKICADMCIYYQHRSEDGCELFDINGNKVGRMRFIPDEPIR